MDPPLWSQDGKSLAVLAPASLDDRCGENLQLAIYERVDRKSVNVEPCARPVRYTGNLLYYVSNYYTEDQKDLVCFNLVDRSKRRHALPKAVRDVTIGNQQNVVYSTAEGLFETEWSSNVVRKISEFGSQPFWDDKASLLLFTRIVSHEEPIRSDIYIARSEPR